MGNEENVSFEELISFKHAIKQNRTGAYILIGLNVAIIVGALAFAFI